MLLPIVSNYTNWCVWWVMVGLWEEIYWTVLTLSGFSYSNLLYWWAGRFTSCNIISSVWLGIFKRLLCTFLALNLSCLSMLSSFCLHIIAQPGTHRFLWSYLPMSYDRSWLLSWLACKPIIKSIKNNLLPRTEAR